MDKPTYRKKRQPRWKKGHIQERIALNLNTSPNCGGLLSSGASEHNLRTWIIKDVLTDLKPVVTEHTFPCAYGSACKDLWNQS